MTGVRRRFPSWIIKAASPVLIALAGFLAFKLTEFVRWERLRQDLKALATEANARVYNRPALRGKALESNAWEEYGAAIPRGNPI